MRAPFQAASASQNRNILNAEIDWQSTLRCKTNIFISALRFSLNAKYCVAPLKQAVGNRVEVLLRNCVAQRFRTCLPDDRQRDPFSNQRNVPRLVNGQRVRLEPLEIVFRSALDCCPCPSDTARLSGSGAVWICSYDLHVRTISERACLCNIVQFRANELNFMR